MEGKRPQKQKRGRPITKHDKDSVKFKLKELISELQQANEAEPSRYLSAMEKEMKRRLTKYEQHYVSN